MTRTRHTKTLPIIISVAALTGCGVLDDGSRPDVDPVDVIDETIGADIMLTAADPNQAVGYFNRKLQQEPESAEFMRGLAISLNRARRTDEAGIAYRRLIDSGKATDTDRIRYASVLIQSANWQEAEAQVNAIPPTVKTYRRYMVEAVLADQKKDWARADSFYETARGLTTRPAQALNNWGISKLARGENRAAADLFVEAITHDNTLFSAKNNLVLARAKQGIYALPVVPMTEEENAILLYNAGLQAARQGDGDQARGLFAQAIEKHPRHYPEAVNALASLEANVRL
jgi:Flp pilus assembly protein TadD